MDKQCLTEQPYERDLNGDCPVVVDQDATTRPHSNLFVDKWSNFTLFYNWWFIRSQSNMNSLIVIISCEVKVGFFLFLFYLYSRSVGIGVFCVTVATALAGNVHKDTPTMYTKNCNIFVSTICTDSRRKCQWCSFDCIS